MQLKAAKDHDSCRRNRQNEKKNPGQNDVKKGDKPCLKSRPALPRNGGKGTAKEGSGNHTPFRRRKLLLWELG